MGTSKFQVAVILPIWRHQPNLADPDPHARGIQLRGRQIKEAGVKTSWSSRGHVSASQESWKERLQWGSLYSRLEQRCTRELTPVEVLERCRFKTHRLPYPAVSAVHFFCHLFVCFCILYKLCSLLYKFVLITHL